MLDTLTHRVALFLDDALGDLVDDLDFSELVDAVVDDLVSRLVKAEAA